MNFRPFLRLLAGRAAVVYGNGMPRDSDRLLLSGDGLTLEDAAAILRGEIRRLEPAPEAVERVRRARLCLEGLLARGQAIYGVNTGFGKLAHQRIAPEENLVLQEHLLRSHAVGMGASLGPGETRLALALRVQALVRGQSGVTEELVRRLIELYNRGVVPRIPELGSVGASGDLAPLAHLALVLMGEGKAWVLPPGERAAPSEAACLEGKEALRRVGLEPYRPVAKEGIALINGTQISCAILADALVQAWNLARVADVAASLTLEATRSSIRPFDPRIQEIRPHPGQRAAAANIRRLLDASQILPDHADCPKIQDAYSIRCLPQVHGAARDALTFVTAVVEREMNSVTDNPLVFPETNEVLSGGNFHGQPLALAADVLAIAAADLASICERRVENLVNPDLSGLPGFLTPKPGLNSGMMLVQVLAAALVSENKTLAHPASVDSIPTSANREDHVSMSTHAARKARTVVRNTARVLACELLCAAQGLEFQAPLRAGKGADAVYRLIREHVPRLESDRVLHPDLEAVEGLILEGEIVRRAAAACPGLE